MIRSDTFSDGDSFSYGDEAIQTNEYSAGISDSDKAEGSKKRLLEEMGTVGFPPFTDDDSYGASVEKGSLKGRVKDHSKKGKTASDDSHQASYTPLINTYSDAPNRFDLYFGKLDRGGIFFVFGPPEHNEAKVKEFEQQLRLKKEADIAYHEALACLESHDFEIAVEQFAFSATNGHSDAQFKLGNASLQGLWGQSQNSTKAIFWLSKAAEQNHPGALYSMSQFYQHGFESIAADPQKANDYYKLAQEHGFSI